MELVAIDWLAGGVSTEGESCIDSCLDPGRGKVVRTLPVHLRSVHDLSFLVFLLLIGCVCGSPVPPEIPDKPGVNATPLTFSAEAVDQISIKLPREKTLINIYTSFTCYLSSRGEGRRRRGSTLGGWFGEREQESNVNDSWARRSKFETGCCLKWL